MIIFWVGTIAELIKLFTVIIEARNNNIPYRIVATGQNRIVGTDVLKLCNENKVDLVLSDSSKIKKSARGLLTWFLKTYFSSTEQLKNLIRNCNVPSSDIIMVVHGDTVSTLMGSLVAKKNGFKLAHVEAGLRSFDIFHPFPEEIDRMLTSKRVDFHFCPSEEAEKNLHKAKVHGKIINTNGNTIYDALQYANKQSFSENLKKQIDSINASYFVFVMHRQENVADTSLFTKTISRVVELAKTKHCVCILHEITKIALEKNCLITQLENENFTLLPRTEYFDFMKILQGADFVITDGGSNQEELAYMGKPTLIMRTKTERNDGLGINAVLCNNDFAIFDYFVNNYNNYHKNQIVLENSPSKVIIENLV